MYSAEVSTPSRRVSTETPSQVVPSFDHLVTQWMSVVISSGGSARNSSQVHLLGGAGGRSCGEDGEAIYQELPWRQLGVLFCLIAAAFEAPGEESFAHVLTSSTSLVQKP